MRSKVTKKIIAITPEEVRESVREYANEMVNSAHSYTEGAEPLQWPSRSELPNYSEKLEKENESLKQSLRELIEDFRAVESTWIRRAYGMGSDYWGSDEEQNIRKSIDRAKSKLNTMKQYFINLKNHPGLPMATGLTMLGMIAGISNESFSVWWHGALFGSLVMGVPTFSIVLISNIKRH